MRLALTSRSAARCFRVIRLAIRSGASASPSSMCTTAPSRSVLNASGPSSSLSSRCSRAADQPLERPHGLRAGEHRAHAVELVLFVRARVEANGLLPSRNVISALAEGDRHDVFALRQPECRVAGMRHHLFEHEISALERQNRVTGGIGRRCKAGARGGVVFLVAPSLPICIPVALRCGKCGNDRHCHDERHYAVWSETYAILLPPRLWRVDEIALALRAMRNKLDVRMTPHGTCRVPLPPVRCAECVRPSSLPSNPVMFRARWPPAAGAHTANTPATCDS